MSAIVSISVSGTIVGVSKSGNPWSADQRCATQGEITCQPSLPRDIARRTYLRNGAPEPLSPLIGDHRDMTAESDSDESNERSTAPQSPYRMKHVLVGLIVLALGVFIVFVFPAAFSIA